MAWRLARSLDVLTDEIRQLSPNATVWTIGDAAHAATASDHNPNPAGVVCAVDIVDDARLDLGAITEHLRTRRHRALKYVIFNRRIASASSSPPWSWRAYNGSNPHTGHAHVSVGTGPDGRSTGPYDDTSPWGLTEEDDDMQLNDPVSIPQWMIDKWPDEGLKDGTISVNTAIGSGYGHGRSGKDETYRQTPLIKAILAAVTGGDAAEAAAQAAREGVREEFATLGPALAAQLADVPAERVEAALRNVLGSLDEG